MSIKKILVCGVAVAILASSLILGFATQGKKSRIITPDEYSPQEIANYGEVTRAFFDHGYRSYEQDGVLHIDLAEIEKNNNLIVAFNADIGEAEAKKDVIDREVLYHAVLGAGEPLPSDEAVAEWIDFWSAAMENSDDELNVQMLEAYGMSSWREYYEKTFHFVIENMVLESYLLKNRPEGGDDSGDWEKTFKEQLIANYLANTEVVIEYIG